MVRQLRAQRFVDSVRLVVRGGRYVGGLAL